VVPVFTTLLLLLMLLLLLSWQQQHRRLLCLRQTVLQRDIERSTSRILHCFKQEMLLHSLEYYAK